jgi:hypothetical protein
MMMMSSGASYGRMSRWQTTHVHREAGRISAHENREGWREAGLARYENALSKDKTSLIYNQFLTLRW